MGTDLIAAGKSKQTKRTAPKSYDKIAMLVGSVTDDTRVYEVPGMKDHCSVVYKDSKSLN
ncbi:hypothetical protein C5167_019911 [Papaver somniferum]|uniref:Uncharacterized protein n=1 Tax=Papaver somniferum TaxID=3469 RepID=A0A4Y7IUR8_PAPSO|nr:hypothetical protein C5167_019911 [Papaver somniferum]